MNYEKTELGISIDEGFRSHPYYDTKKNVTIGLGDNLSAKGYTMEQANAKYPDGISLEEAKENMKDKINSIVHDLERNVPFFDSLDDVRQYVLVNMAYNLGIPKFIQFRDMLMYLKDKQYLKSSNAMKYNQNGTKTPWFVELPDRVYKLASMMSTGNW